MIIPRTTQSRDLYSGVSLVKCKSFTSIYVIELADTVIYLSKSSVKLSLSEMLVIVSSESPCYATLMDTADHSVHIVIDRTTASTLTCYTLQVVYEPARYDRDFWALIAFSSNR